MAYTHPAAIERLCEEIERTVWPSDRKFFSDHPRRSHRLRPAMSAEVSADEIATGKILECPPGMQVFTAVKQLGPGVRARALFVAPAVARWVDPPEAICRAWYDFVCRPQFKKQEQAFFSNAWRGGRS
jgi:hypothetical protein